MADEADMANDRIEKIEERNIAAIRAAAAEMLESKRLVNDMCAPCRDMRF